MMARLTGAKDLSLSATSDNSVITEAKAGGAATGGSGVGIGGAVAISVASNETEAVVGSGDALTLSGALSAVATHKGSTTSAADGSAGGSSAGVGIALGLNVATDTTLATTERTIAAAGDVMFAAHAAAASSAGAKASAAGAKQEENTPDSEGVDKQVGAQRGLADKKATEAGTKGTDGAAATPKAETSEGGVSVAAAVGVNIANSTARAFIPDNGTVTSGGLLTLSASNTTDATAKANGSAVSAEDANGAASVNIGAAVAINLVNAVNEAYIGEDAEVQAQWVTVEAKRTEVAGRTSGTVGAEAISGASGGKIGIAGSVALNISQNTSEARIKDGAQVTLLGGDVKIVAEGPRTRRCWPRPRARRWNRRQR
jgi:mucin-19